MKFRKYLEESKCDAVCCEETQVSELIENNVFRVGSRSYYEYFRNIRESYKAGQLNIISSKFDIELLEGSLGEFAEYEGNPVPLDCPLFEEEDKDPPIGKPRRGGPKKFYVYVRKADGGVKKVTFGAKDGGSNLSVKLNNPDARRSFVARHRCDQQNDKESAAYWACRLPYYAKQLGMSGGGSFFW